jgi:hypothetical protein
VFPWFIDQQASTAQTRINDAYAFEETPPTLTSTGSSPLTTPAFT